MNTRRQGSMRFADAGFKLGTLDWRVNDGTARHRGVTGRPPNRRSGNGETDTGASLSIRRVSRSFTTLAGSNLAAHSAEQLSLAVVPMLAVAVLGAGPAEIGLLAMAQTLPFLLLSIPMGLAADRWSRRSLMLLGELLRGLALIVLIAAGWSGVLSIGLLAMLGFLGAMGTVAFSVALPSLVPAIVPFARLGQANARLELTRSAAFAAGPALGGVLVAWAGAPSAMVLAALLSGAAIALLVGLVEPDRAPRSVRHPLLELKDGAHLVWSHSILRPVLLTAVAWNVSWFVLQAAYVPYAMRVLGMGTAAVGITLAMYGLGMICGALPASRLIAHLPFGRVIQVGPAISVLAAAALAATLFVPSAALAGLGFFLFGAGPILWTIASTTLRQAVAPQHMLGRVSAIFMTVNAGARPLGAALGAVVGAQWGEGACLMLALFGFALQAGIILDGMVSRMKTIPAAVC